MKFRKKINIRYIIVFYLYLFNKLAANRIRIYYVVSVVIYDVVSLSMFLYRSVYRSKNLKPSCYNKRKL